MDQSHRMDGIPVEDFGLIFNHVKLLSSNHRRRPRGLSDVDAAQATLRLVSSSGLRCSKLFADLTASSLLDVLRRVPHQKSFNNDCFGCSVAVYTDMRATFYTKDRDFAYRLCCLEQFKSKDGLQNLLGKPKHVFHSRPARGDNFDRGVEVTDGDGDTLGTLWRPPAGVGVGKAALASSADSSEVPLVVGFLLLLLDPARLLQLEEQPERQLTEVLSTHAKSTVCRPFGLTDYCEPRSEPVALAQVEIGDAVWTSSASVCKHLHQSRSQNSNLVEAFTDTF
uniref:RAB3GAP2_N domain-containing protein n=1 Tax=Macrostomum lignano TaxID=282301 RepID=A0A1I8FE75_9PLAT